MQRLPKMSVPLWALLGVWTVGCGFLTLHCIGVMGQWKLRANGFQRNNAHLVRELTLAQQQLHETRSKLATTQTRLAATQNQLLNAQSQLQQEQSSPEEALFKAIRHNDAHAVATLLDSGVNPNCYVASDNYRQTALVVAVETGYGEGPEYEGTAPRNNLAVVRTLLAHGADVNRFCSDGGTWAMSVARRHSSGDLIAMLKKAGAKERE